MLKHAVLKISFPTNSQTYFSEGSYNSFQPQTLEYMVVWLLHEKIAVLAPIKSTLIHSAPGAFVWS